MRILSVCGFSALWGKHLPANLLDLEEGPTCGGGEEAALQTAIGLRALGNDVTLYWYGRPGVYRGVEFRGLDAPMFSVIVGEEWDVIIAWSCIRPLEYAQKRTRRIFSNQLNDLSLLADWSVVDCVVSPSHDHAKRLRTWGWEGRQAVVHNGVDPEVYADAPAWDERPMDVGYWSSPDRGLHHLLRAWPYVVKQEPRARLRVAYEIKRLLDWIRILPASFYGERGQTLGRLVLEASNDPTVEFLGSIPRKKLAKYQRRCRVHCYPLDPFGYVEGFATSIAQGLAAGCFVMSMPMDALPSLYGDGIYWMNELDFMDRDYPRLLAQRIVQGLRGDLPNQDTIRKRGTQIGLSYTWAEAAKQMERACRGEWLDENWWRKAA